MLFQILILKWCRDFHEAVCVMCILNIKINACIKAGAAFFVRDDSHFYYFL